MNRLGRATSDASESSDQPHREVDNEALESRGAVSRKGAEAQSWDQYAVRVSRSTRIWGRIE
jgi:hypothetical protein